MNTRVYSSHKKIGAKTKRRVKSYLALEREEVGKSPLMYPPTVRTLPMVGTVKERKSNSQPAGKLEADSTWVKSV